MNVECSTCARKFDREPGYLLGSIYFNYGVTSVLVTVFYFSCYFTETLVGKPLLFASLLIGVVFPICFFRYARSLWIALDELFDPWKPE